MRKIITILLSFLFISFQSAKAEFGIGVTGAFHMIEADGTETTRQSGQRNNGSHSEDVVVPELFVETFLDGGYTFGLSYIPTREMGSKSRSDTSTSGDGQEIVDSIPFFRQNCHKSERIARSLRILQFFPEHFMKI